MVSGQPIRLTTERLILRDFVAADEPGVHAYRSDPEVARYLLTHQPERPEETGVWLRQVIEESQRPRTHYTLTIEAREESIWPKTGEPTVSLRYTLSREAWPEASSIIGAQTWGG